MKYLDEFQDPDLARRLLDDIRATVTRPWAMMEVCGGQTHSIIRHGIDQLLPDGIELIHGPGCPVCVTPLEMIDKALEIASRPDVIFCSFGDMLRVPGSDRDLFRVKSAGGDVRVVYSPLDALKLARENPDRQVVFFGIGFETTAPPNAMTVYQAKRLGIENFSLLVSHVRVPPAIEAIMTSPGLPGAGLPGRRSRLQGDGHRRVPAARGALRGADRGHRLRTAGHPRGHPADRAPARGGPGTRSRTPTPERSPPRGTRRRQRCWTDVFEVVDRSWRGIGMIPQSGWRLSERYRDFDAEQRFEVGDIRHRGVEHLPQRRGAAGADQAARVRGVRHRLHAAQPARRHHGLQRGGLRGVLPLPAAPAADAAARAPTQAIGAGRGDPRRLTQAPRRQLRRLDLSAAAARQPDDRDGSRRRRRDVRRAGRAPVPARASATTPGPAAGRLRGARPRRATAGLLDRLVRGPAAVLPRRDHRRSRRQRHGQRPGDERGAGALPVDRLHPRGGHRHRRRSEPSPSALGAAAPAGRRARRHRRHQGGGLRSRRRRLHQHRRDRRGARGRRHPAGPRPARRRGPRQRRHRRARNGDHERA